MKPRSEYVERLMQGDDPEEVIAEMSDQAYDKLEFLDDDPPKTVYDPKQRQCTNCGEVEGDDVTFFMGSPKGYCDDCHNDTMPTHPVHTKMRGDA